MGQSGLELKTNGYNDFHKQNQAASTARHEPFWQAVYAKAFPDMIISSQVLGQSTAQDRGVDRLIYLSNDKVLKIDEKVRFAEYDDILLEYVSNDKRQSVGRIEKPLAIDYIAYAFLQSQRCYLFPWAMLRRTWLHKKVEWLALGKVQEQGFRLVSARNPSYNTLSVAVPIKVLRHAISLAAIIEVGETS